MFLTVLAFAALPVLGNLAGALLAERMHVDRTRLSLALHAAAGVIVGVLGLELLPRVLEADVPWLVLASMLAGGLAFVLMDSVTEHVARRRRRERGAKWVPMYAGTALDLFSDGVLVGVGSTFDLGLGLLLALGQVPADLPEGFATAAALKSQEVPRRRRVLLMGALGLPILLGAGLGFFLLRDASLAARAAVVAFTAGALLTLLIEEIVPEAHEGPQQRRAVLWFLAGFGLFFAVRNLFEA